MAISFNSNTSFILKQKTRIKGWIAEVVRKEKKECGDISYVFCDDEEVLKINIQYLNHKTLTDIITFDYSENKKIGGDIFISIERVKENSNKYGATFEDELHRVMIHGVLHLCGYKDKTPKDEKLMRKKEDDALRLF